MPITDLSPGTGCLIDMLSGLQLSVAWSGEGWGNFLEEQEVKSGEEKERPLEGMCYKMRVL